MVAGTILTRCLLQDIEVDNVVVFQPLLGLVYNNRFALRHLDSHASSCCIAVKEFTFALIQLLSHRRSNRVLVHEEIVPVCLIVEICLENLLLFSFVIGGFLLMSF